MGINILSHLFDLFFSSTWERFATVHRVAREVDAISILEEAVEDGVDIGRVADNVAQRLTGIWVARMVKTRWWRASITFMSPDAAPR
jgi:hypothetical protein